MKAVLEIDRVLKPSRPLFMRVASTEHPFFNTDPSEIYGFSHIGSAIQRGMPVHFFTKEELTFLFSNYRIERLEHIAHPLNHPKITVPLREWVMLAYKK